MQSERLSELTFGNFGKNFFRGPEKGVEALLHMGPWVITRRARCFHEKGRNTAPSGTSWPSRKQQP